MISELQRSANESTTADFQKRESNELESNNRNKFKDVSLSC